MENKIISKERLMEIVDKTVLEFIKENNVAPAGSVPQVRPQAQVQQQSIPTPVSKPKATVVNFDSETEAPFTVNFSERGFSIGGVRLSFETLKNALSKQYTITLEQGQGLELTPVRMQKILKYEDKY